MTETMKQNPYKSLGTVFVTKVAAGAKSQVKSDVGTLSERLTQYAYYMTEQQKDAGDALFVMDLHDAVKILRKHKTQ